MQFHITDRHIHILKIIYLYLCLKIHHFSVALGHHLCIQETRLKDKGGMILERENEHVKDFRYQKDKKGTWVPMPGCMLGLMPGFPAGLLSGLIPMPCLLWFKNCSK